MFPNHQNYLGNYRISDLLSNLAHQGQQQQMNFSPMNTSYNSMQRYPGSTSHPMMNPTSFPSNPILNRNLDRNQQPLLNQATKQMMSNRNKVYQHQAMNLLHQNQKTCNGNRDFFDQSFFRDTHEPRLNGSRRDVNQQSVMAEGKNNDSYDNDIVRQSSPGFHTEWLHDSSIDQQFEMMNGFKYAENVHEPAAIEKYSRPKCLTKEEYEEIRRDFESNGKNVLDEDDHTWSSPKPKQPMDVDEFPSEFPPLHVSAEEKLSQTWKISEGFAMKLTNSCRQQNGSQNLYDGWGTKLDKNPFEDHCVFCKNNDETSDVYMSHTLKDFDGRTTCPRLRLYTCPICSANGDNAHTLHYCPKRHVVALDEQKAKAKSQRSLIKGGRWSFSKE